MLSDKILFATMITLIVVLSPTLTPASSHSERDAAAIRTQLSSLEERLARLEALVPTFASMMPNFSERFHVMHYAADAGDWAVANHELLEMRRLLEMAGIIDPEKGKLMKSFLSANLQELQEAIEHGNRKKFDAALQQTVQNCNVCHQAAGSPFINVSLDVPSRLSLRHPHLLAGSKVGEMQHTH